MGKPQSEASKIVNRLFCMGEPGNEAKLYMTKATVFVEAAVSNRSISHHEVLMCAMRICAVLFMFSNLVIIDKGDRIHFRIGKGTACLQLLVPIKQP